MTEKKESKVARNKLFPKDKLNRLPDQRRNVSKYDTAVGELSESEHSRGERFAYIQPEDGDSD